MPLHATRQEPCNLLGNRSTTSNVCSWGFLKRIGPQLALPSKHPNRVALTWSGRKSLRFASTQRLQPKGTTPLHLGCHQHTPQAKGSAANQAARKQMQPFLQKTQMVFESNNFQRASYFLASCDSSKMNRKSSTC